MKPAQNTIDKKIQRESTPRCARWGLSPSDYKSHVALHGTSMNPKSPMGKYAQQRSNAARRGIEWQFTFSTWWQLWQDSGKWAERGCGAGTGYVMARKGDGDTPYSPSTVYICTSGKNAKDSFVNLPATKRNRTKQAPGSGLGYAIDKKGGTKPFIASFRKKTLGRFPTPELARAAYLAAFEQYQATQTAA